MLYCDNNFVCGIKLFAILIIATIVLLKAIKTRPSYTDALYFTLLAGGFMIFLLVLESFGGTEMETLLKLGSASRASTITEFYIVFLYGLLLGILISLPFLRKRS
jgi:hypothetical protein